MFVLSFPDGSIIEGFEWSVMGWYYKDFPPSGINSMRSNRLQFTPDALAEHKIILLKD